MKFKAIIQTTLILIIQGTLLLAQSQKLAIIPEPYELSINQGKCYRFGKEIKIYLQADDKLLRSAIENLSFINKSFSFEITNDEKVADVIVESVENDDLGKEGYRMEVGAERIKLYANKSAGLFYGLKTLEQIINLGGDSKLIACLSIKDKPRFSYRGVMLDVSRHFFTVDELKRLIDNISKLKFNYFHWHLVDDQGWRIEIKKYPKLTAKGATRNGAISSENGFFYTQDEIRDLVKYAQERFVEIIPEIEMPGHSRAVLDIMKDLRCPEANNSNVYCAGNDSSFLFLEDVISEVAQLFPGQYIHVGGDEANKSAWKACCLCQSRMKETKLNSEYELQSYFIKRMEKVINCKGKKMLGWSEILEGGLAPSATVMSWLGEESAVEAANAGHDAILTPSQKCYFDMAQGDFYTEPPSWVRMTNLKMVYEYDYLPKNLEKGNDKHIIGGQACLWSECIASESHLQYMAFPRLFALSEALWTPCLKKNYDYFISRLFPQLQLLEKQNTNFRFPYSVFFQQINNTVIMEAEIPSTQIEYSLSLDGKTMSKTIPYKQPFQPTMPVLFEVGIRQQDKNFPKSRFVVANFINNEQLKVLEVSSESRNSTNAIDLQSWGEDLFLGIAFPTWTYWETKENKPPHFITIDLGKEESLAGFAYYPRTDGIEEQLNKTGNILKFEVYVSNSAANLTTLHYNGRFSGDRQPEMVVFEPIKARYVKIVITDGVNGKAAIADLRFFRVQ